MRPDATNIRPGLSPNLKGTHRFPHVVDMTMATMAIYRQAGERVITRWAACRGSNDVDSELVNCHVDDWFYTVLYGG